jgi:hypothetical protein
MLTVWLLTPENTWQETSHRHPEKLVRYASAEFQQACLRRGGRNYLGMANFRLVWAPSRFAFTGGTEVQFWDAQGNLTRQMPETVFVPRYTMPFGWEHCYVLERWMSPEWYEEQGWMRGSHEWGAFTKFRSMDPIDNRGGYEALEISVDQAMPFFPQWNHARERSIAPMTPRMVEYAIVRYGKSLETPAAVKLAWAKERKAREEAARRARSEEECLEAMPAHPFVPWSLSADKARGAG